MSYVDVECELYDQTNVQTQFVKCTNNLNCSKKRTKVACSSSFTMSVVRWLVLVSVLFTATNASSTPALQVSNFHDQHQEPITAESDSSVSSSTTSTSTSTTRHPRYPAPNVVKHHFDHSGEPLASESESPNQWRPTNWPYTADQEHQPSPSIPQPEAMTKLDHRNGYQSDYQPEMSSYSYNHSPDNPIEPDRPETPSNVDVDQHYQEMASYKNEASKPDKDFVLVFSHASKSNYDEQLEQFLTFTSL